MIHQNLICSTKTALVILKREHTITHSVYTSKLFSYSSNVELMELYDFYKFTVTRRRGKFVTMKRVTPRVKNILII